MNLTILWFLLFTLYQVQSINKKKKRIQINRHQIQIDQNRKAGKKRLRKKKGAVIDVGPNDNINSVVKEYIEGYNKQLREKGGLEQYVMNVQAVNMVDENTDVEQLVQKIQGKQMFQQKIIDKIKKDIQEIIQYFKKTQTKKEIETGYECNDNPEGCQKGNQCVLYCDYGNSDSKKLQYNVRYYFQKLDQSQIDQQKCHYYCVKQDQQKCEQNVECMSEFCNHKSGSVCTDRLKEGEECKESSDCEFYNCENGKCKNPVMYYLVKKNDNDFRSEQEIKSSSSYNNFYQQKDKNIESNKQLHNFNQNCKQYGNMLKSISCLTDDGILRIRALDNEYCYINNDRIDEGSVNSMCNKGYRCVRQYSLKNDYLNGDDRGINPLNQIQGLQNQDNGVNNKDGNVDDLDKKIYQKMRFMLLWQDMVRVIRNRDSVQQITNNHNPDGNKFEISYLCKKPLNSDCNPDLKGFDCESNYCLGKKCKQKKVGEKCVQAYECEEGNCYLNEKGDQFVCQIRLVNDKKNNEKQKCEYGYQCKSEICLTNKLDCEGPGKLDNPVQKYCQEARSLKLNEECKTDRQCGDHGSVKMKCLISDGINSCDSGSLGYSRLDMFRLFKQDFLQMNYPRQQLASEFKNNEQASNDYDMQLNVNRKPDISYEELFNQIVDNGFLYKCKIPHNEDCQQDDECPQRNKCVFGKCRGWEGAVCSSNLECYADKEDHEYQFRCQQGYDLNSVYFAINHCVKVSQEEKKKEYEVREMKVEQIKYAISEQPVIKGVKKQTRRLVNRQQKKY